MSINPDHIRAYWDERLISNPAARASLRAPCNVRPAVELTRSRIWLQRSTAWLLGAVLLTGGFVAGLFIHLLFIQP